MSFFGTLYLYLLHHWRGPGLWRWTKTHANNGHFIAISDSVICVWTLKTFLFVPDLLLTLIIVVGAVVGGHIVVVGHILWASISGDLAEHGLVMGIPGDTGLLVVA